MSKVSTKSEAPKVTRAPSTTWEKVRPFIFGGLSGSTATLFVQPVDNIKVRIQTFGEDAGIKSKQIETKNPFKASKIMFKNEGIWAFYRGIDAGVTRQCVYATVRFGTYKSITEYIEKERAVTSPERVAYSMFAGLVGATFGNPFDLVLVRMQSDTTHPPELRRNYSSVFHGLWRIPKEEGFAALWRGYPSFAMRGIACTCAQLATFEEVKQAIMAYRNQTNESVDFLTRFL